MRETVRTALCEMLGIEHPVLLAGMGSLTGEGHVAQPKLVAAVSEAGGMGVLGGAGLSLEELRLQIREIKSLTRKPFGVDVLLPEELGAALPFDLPRAELRRRFVPKEHAQFVDRMSQRYDVPTNETEAIFILNEAHAKGQVRVMLDEGVPLCCAGLGFPRWLVPMAREGGMKVLGLAGNVRAAARIRAAGADLVVAQGHEAGGHTGQVGTLALVPQVVDAVAPVPVIAAGGIGDGRGLAAALALGAVGAWVGTAFLFALEANVPDAHRQMMRTAGEQDTQVGAAWTGKTLRQLKNPIQMAFDRSGLYPLPMAVQMSLMLDLVHHLARAKRYDLLCAPAGQIVGMLTETKPAREILETMVAQAAIILREKLGTLLCAPSPSRS
jgi:nitronate monooxygenase